ncbi:MAG: hypothetical protein U5K69_15460 [Balneolaceae bacterium]|nr:hypothetical protein [Balneolaceae bacterium]
MINLEDPATTGATVYQASSEGREQEAGFFVPEGRVELTAQNQEVGGISNDVMKGNVDLIGPKGQHSLFGVRSAHFTRIVSAAGAKPIWCGAVRRRLAGVSRWPYLPYH